MYFSTGFCVLPAPKAGKYTLFFSVLIAFKKRQKRKGKMCFKQMGVYSLSWLTPKSLPFNLSKSLVCITTYVYSKVRQIIIIIFCI